MTTNLFLDQVRFSKHSNWPEMMTKGKLAGKLAAKHDPAHGSWGARALQITRKHTIKLTNILPRRVQRVGIRKVFR